MSRKITYAEVAQAFRDRGCVLLSQTYTRSKDRLEFTCICGRTAWICYDKFKAGQLCKGCRGERQGERTRYSLEYIRTVFESGGCVLLDNKYTSNKQKLLYRCSCGNISEIALIKFQIGQRCSKCKGAKISEKLTGSNNPRWRADLTAEDRVKERTMLGYTQWRKDVFARDDYTCVSCGVRGGRLVSHHIEGYARVPEKRIDIDNGVTLCVECHDDYHRKIRHADGDTDSFIYFMTDYRDPWYAGEVPEREEEEEAA